MAVEADLCCLYCGTPQHYSNKLSDSRPAGIWCDHCQHYFSFEGGMESYKAQAQATPKPRETNPAQTQTQTSEDAPRDLAIFPPIKQPEASSEAPIGLSFKYCCPHCQHVTHIHHSVDYGFPRALVCQRCGRASHWRERLPDDGVENSQAAAREEMVWEGMEIKEMKADWAEAKPEGEKMEEAIAGKISDIMEALGLSGPGTEETPQRVARFLLEFNQPCDLIALLKAFDHEDSPNGGQPMVIQQGIPFNGLCMHHWLPFYGTCDIGYIPGKMVVGLSKLTRLVKASGKRVPTIQERVTNELADAIDKGLDAKGVIVVVRAAHTCMSCRGVNTPGVTTITSAIRGALVHNPTARMEFFELLKTGT